MTSYLYTGAPQALTLGKTDYALVPGKTYDVPAGDKLVEHMVAAKLFVAAPKAATAATKKPNTSSKEEKQNGDQ